MTSHTTSRYDGAAGLKRRHRRSALRHATTEGARKNGRCSQMGSHSTYDGEESA